MSEIMKMNQIATMSSREIAELTNSRHSDVCRSIERAVDQNIIGAYATGVHPYIDPQNGQTYKEYRLQKRDCLVVVARISPQFTAAVVDRWQELEAAQAPKLPTTYLEALKALVASTEAQQALEAQNAELKPRALIADRIHDAGGDMKIAEAAKILGTGQNRLFKILRGLGVLNSANIPLQRYIESGYFHVKERPIVKGEEVEAYQQTFVTPKGLCWLARKVNFDKEREAAK